MISINKKKALPQSIMPTNKYRENNGIRKSFGNHHNKTRFRQESTLEDETSG